MYDVSNPINSSIQDHDLQYCSVRSFEGPGGHTRAYNEAHGVPRFWHGFSFHHTNFLTYEMRVNILCIALNLGSVVLVEFLHACMHSTSSSCILSKCFLVNLQKFFHVHERHPRSVISSGFGFYEEAFLIFRLL